MGVIILGICLLVSFTGFGALVYALKDKYDRDNCSLLRHSLVGFTAGLIGMFFATGVSATAITFSTMSTVNESEKFYDIVTADGYKEAGDVVVVPDNQISINYGGNRLTQIQPGKNLVHNLSYGYVEEFRRNVYKYHKMQDGFFLGLFWRNMPDHIKPIVLESEVAVETKK